MDKSDQDQKYVLPRLRRGLRLLSGAVEPVSGAPTGLLHDPVSNGYFKLNWAECECLSRFPFHETVEDLIVDVRMRSGLDLDRDDVMDLIGFLAQNNLLELTGEEMPRYAAPQGIWKKLLHQYLYFTIPLFQPQGFLERSYPLVAPLLSKGASQGMAISFFVLAFLTLRRADEFFSTFPDMPTASGIVTVAAVFAFIKIVHEWAHAYAAVKHKVSVPHMGIAFIVLYPVLYTETSGAWRLKDKWHRMEIAFAGVRAELFLATLFLFLWHVSPVGGAIQTVSFYVVAVSLVSSLLVNLNPLMRFDGYYLLSDFTGIENLQTRSCAFARHRLRRILFAFDDPIPEALSPGQTRFLTIFGFALLIYRFFLFAGIAALVYHMFFQPLGLILFCIEIWFFILMPVLSELKIWWARRLDILASGRSKIALAVAVIVLSFCVLPVQGTFFLPAVSYHRTYWQAHAASPAEIVNVSVQEGDMVAAGDILISLKSPELVRDMDLARQKLAKLESMKRKGGFLSGSNESLSYLAGVDGEIVAARKEIAALEEIEQRLVIMAPFGGQVRDVLSGLRVGRYVKREDVLFRIVDPAQVIYEAYIDEMDRDRISQDSAAAFIASDQPFSSLDLKIISIDKTGAEKISTPELMGEIGGNVLTDAGLHTVVSREGLYKVMCVSRGSDSGGAIMKRSGWVKVQGERRSLFMSWMRRIAGFFLREFDAR